MLATGVIVAAGAARAGAAPPKWVQRIDDVVGNDAVSVAIGYEGEALYRHKDWVPRAPASNEKLLLSMALLDRVAADADDPHAGARDESRAAPTASSAGICGSWVTATPRSTRHDIAALAAGAARPRGSSACAAG